MNTSLSITMDGPNCEHSDSDSGESWTMLDHSPSHADEAPEFPGTPGNHEGEAETTDHTDRDDDTDGISIISDSEPESCTPCGLTASDPVAAECGDCTTEQHTSLYISDSPQPTNKLENIHENIRSQHDFLGDTSGKMRTYVHRRNKRLSTVLNIIVLGSLITAAGVAIGHMWGARDDCAAPPPPSVNKILSNLYKLQEENAYLRSKLKELTLANTLLINQLKIDSQKNKQINMKGFDDNMAKCAAFDYCSSNNVLESHLVEPEFEKDFLSDINKLKTVYKQNRSWLDEEIAKRTRYEELNLKKSNNHFKLAKKDENNKITKPEIDATDTLVTIEDEPPAYTTTGVPKDIVSDRKISYSDSLKIDSKNVERKKRNIKEVGGYNFEKESGRKKKSKRQLEVISEKSLSDDEIIKDNRYNVMKHKEEKKKNRQKTNKKQKRRNKYEQWEMKGGYLKDYDDVSVASSQDAAGAPKGEREPSDFVLIINDANENQNESTGRYNNDKKPKKGEKDSSNWYDKRMSQRSEARKRLEQEMFGGGGERGGAGAGWYFRRARRREHGRDERPTHPAHSSKRNMNYKTKQ